MLKRKFLFTTLFLLLFVLAACGEKEVELSKVEIPEGIYEGQFVLGNPNAPVKIIEFGDYMCGHCKAWSNSMFTKLADKYADGDDVAIYFLNYAAIGDESKLRALAVETVLKQDQEQAWIVHEKIFENQQKTFDKDSIIELIKKYTKGLDYEEIEKHINQVSYIDEVLKDMDYGDELKILGTPSVFINDIPIPDGHLYNFKTYEMIIDDLLNELKKSGETNDEK